MIRVFLTDVEKYMDEPCFGRALCHISTERRKKAEGYRFAKDRALSLGASVLLDRALSEEGFRESGMTYCTEQNGKSCFPGYVPFHFNISHSGTKAALVISDRPVGCDIQIIKETDPGMVGRFYSAAERAYVKSAPDPEERSRRFIRVWALKESYAKALGKGLGIEPASYSVTDEKGRAACPASFEVAYTFYEYDVPGYAFCVCAPEGEHTEVQFK